MHPKYCTCSLEISKANGTNLCTRIRQSYSIYPQPYRRMYTNFISDFFILIQFCLLIYHTNSWLLYNLTQNNLRMPCQFLLLIIVPNFPQLHRDFDMYGLDRVDATSKPRFSATQQFLAFMGVMTFFVGTYYLLEGKKSHWPLVSNNLFLNTVCFT